MVACAFQGDIKRTLPSVSLGRPSQPGSGVGRYRKAVGSFFFFGGGGEGGKILVGLNKEADLELERRRLACRRVGRVMGRWNFRRTVRVRA